MLQTNEKDNKKIEYIALYYRVDSANSQVNTLGILTQKNDWPFGRSNRALPLSRSSIWWTAAFLAVLLTALVFRNSFLVTGNMLLWLLWIFPGSAVICSLLTNLLTMPTPRERRSMC